MSSPDDGDWSQVEQLLLRAETLLHAAADSLDQQRDRGRRERERIAGGLEGLRGPLTRLRLELIGLVEEMAGEASQPGASMWQGRLQGQLPSLEHALIALDRLLVDAAEPVDAADAVDGDGPRPRLVHLELEEILEQRNRQLIDLRAQVERLDGIVRAAGLSPDAFQESGSI
jgi:hypothetical protein